MIDWKYFIKKYGDVDAPHKFEEIALAYVQDIYPQYSWYPTKKTRDGNKDAQRKEVYFGEDDSFDVWEEAKFKRERMLRRQDIDPTILSGLIQGNVRLIVFVCNTHIPDKLLDRAILGARIKGTKVSCVLADQLESWLVLNPHIYKKYWENRAIKKTKTYQIAEIQSISFFDMVSNDFNAFSTRKLMVVGDFYLLTVSISSSIKSSAKLVLVDDFPFDIVLHPNYDDPDHLDMDCGINTFALLLKAKCTFSGGVNLCFNINGALYSRVSQEIEIVIKFPARIAYAQQLELTNKIKGFIDAVPSGNSGNLLTICSDSGMGKSFVLKSIYETYALKRDMTIVEFESDKHSMTNYLLLCRITLFFFYGNIFWNRDAWSDEEIVSQKAFAIRNNVRDLFDDSLLGQLFDGCFDANVAKDVIERLARRLRKKSTFIPTRATLAKKILLLDDFQYLSKLQAKFMYQIINNLHCYSSDCIVIISATKGRFASQKDENKFLNITPSTFELTGLTPDDMAETLGVCFHLPPATLRRTAWKILSPNPLLTTEVLRILQEKAGAATKDFSSVICAYSESKDQAQILKNRFDGLQSQYYLLDILYRFKKGIPQRIVIGFDGFSGRDVQTDLDILASKNIIIIQEGLVYPYHDYFVKSYIQLRREKYYNSSTGKFLSYLLDIPNYEELFDSNHILSMLIACGNKYHKLYEKKVKEIIRHYMQTTQFGAALHYCACYYKIVRKSKPSAYTREEFNYIYSYAYCLVHCGNRDLASRLLETIYTYAKENVPEKYLAGAELLNQRFWELKPDGIVERSFLIASGATHMLQSTSLSKDDSSRLEEACSICFNRRMVTYLLLDRWEKGRATYEEYLQILAKTFHGSDFRSHSATLIMDYARGISFITPKFANNLIHKALNFFLCQKKNHYRRILLCKIDCLLLRCINDEADAFWEMEPIINELLQGGFGSEYFKAILKRCACESIFISQNTPSFVTSKSSPSTNAHFVNDLIERITNALLECGLQPGPRDSFLFCNLMAYFSICKGDRDQAIRYLQKVRQHVRLVGPSYKKIVEHNLRCVDTISRIAWCTQDTPFNQDEFLLDCRFW